MKKIIYSVIMCGLLLASCGKELTGVAEELELSSKSMTFDAAGGDTMVYVKCDGFWNYYTNERDWIVCYDYGSNGNDSVKFTVLENTAKSARTGTIIFNAGYDLKATLTIKQNPKSK